MATAPELLPDARSDTREGGIAIESPPPDGFLWRQIMAAGLAAIAEKIAAGRPLVLDDAIALSRSSLPLLAKIVELRPAARETVAPGAFPIERVASRPSLRPRVGQGLTDWDVFCQTLITVRNECRPGDAAGFWYPILDGRLDGDRPGDGDFTGVDILRAIALARLVLPEQFEVRAPLASLGPKVAQVALDFGASHLGYVALDGQTPSERLVADAAMLDELLGSVSTTQINAPADRAPCTHGPSVER